MDSSSTISDPDFVDENDLSQFLDDEEQNFRKQCTGVSKVSSLSGTSSTHISTEICENPSFYHLKILKKYFGHSNFRPMQWQIICSLLKDKRDNCAVMTTGYGKSLCYQYPAIYSGGITLVVSPLISLMEDQVLSLKVSNISACLLGTAQKERNKVVDQIFDKKYSIIYLTPEFASGEYGMGLLKLMKKKLDICLIAVDEAHCISSWGHDFRFQYRHLGNLRDILTDIPVLAVTATATQKVEADIIRSLRLKNPQVLHSGYDRPNLYLEVIHKSQQGPMYDFHKVLDQVCGSWKFPGSTIIYCLTRKVTETIAQLLKMKGINCEAYHAGKSLKDRKDVHEKFLKDQLDAIVATSAFGMGIDKPDIRCIVHYGTPSTIEAYYQEIGRAGRDGEPSRCVLFFNESDFQTHRLISQKNYNSYGGSKHEEEMSIKVRKYLHSTTECRRAYIISYFGENYSGKNNHCCDICYVKSSGIQQKYEGIDKDGYYDFTEDAEKMLKSIEALGGRYGLSIYILFLRGSKVGRLKEDHKKHPLHGCGKNKSENWWKALGQMLVQENYIMRKAFCMKGFTTSLLNLTFNGEKFIQDLADGKTVKLMLKPPSDILEQLKQKTRIQVQSYNSGGVPETSSKAVLIQNVVRRNKQEEMNKKLYALLMERRYQIADEKDCMPHNVISIPDVKELIRVKPKTLKELEKCNFEMFSEFKIHQFGQILVDIIATELGPGDNESNEATISMVEALLNIPLPVKTSASAEISYNLLKQGRSIQEISEQRGMAPSTIFSHLLDCLKRGLPITLEQMGVDKFARLVIVRVILETPGSLLTPIKEKCPPDVTWDQIRTVLTYMKVRDHLDENQIDYKDFEEFSYESLKSDAGCLDLASIKCSDQQLKCSAAGTSSTTNCSTSTMRSSEVKPSKEDRELDEFLKICADLIHDDELQLQEKAKSEIHANSQQCDRNPIQKTDDVFQSSPNSPKVYETLNTASSISGDELHENVPSEDQELDNFLNMCADIINETEVDNPSRHEVLKVQQLEATVGNTVDSVDMKSNSDSDDEVFRSPPRSEFAIDSSVPFKIPKYA